MTRRFFFFCLLFLLIAGQPLAAYAYLPVIMGLVSAVGGVAAFGITAILGGVYIVYRFLRGKKDDDEDASPE